MLNLRKYFEDFNSFLLTHKLITIVIFFANMIFFNYACYTDILFPGIYKLTGSIKPHIILVENIFYAGVIFVIGWYLCKINQKYYNCMAIAGIALLVYILLERHWRVSASYLVFGNNVINTLQLPLVLILPFISYNINKISNEDSFSKLGYVSILVLCFLFSIIILLIANSFSLYLVFIAVVLSQLFASRINKTRRLTVIFALVSALLLTVGYVSLKYPGRISSGYEGFFNDSNYGSAYQSLISIETIKSGGLTGKGLGSVGFDVPDVSSDYMLVLIGKQFGYIGLVYFVLLYLFLFYTLYLLVKSLPISGKKHLATAAVIFIITPFVLQIIRILNLLPFIPSYRIPFFSMVWDYSHFIALGTILQIIYANRKTEK